MSKLRAARPQKRVAGAFAEARECDLYEDDDLDDRDAFRSHVVEAVSSTWSYSQIREYGERLERDRERAREIAEIFEGLSGGALEELCFLAHQRHLLRQRDDRRLNHAKRQASRRRYKARYDSDPEFRERQNRLAKARYLRWREKNPRPKKEKLSRDTAAEIRTLYATGLFQTDLAKLYDVTISTISLTVKGKTWKNAEGPVVERAPRTRRVLPLVKCAEKVEAQLEKKRARKRLKYAEDPEYFKRCERERRERDPEAQRAKDREAYRQGKADKMKEKYRQMLASETPQERQVRLEKHRAVSNRYYEAHRDQILAKQAAAR